MVLEKGHTGVRNLRSLPILNVEFAALYVIYAAAKTDVTHTDIQVTKNRTNANPRIPIESKNSSITSAPTTLATIVATLKAKKASTGTAPRVKKELRAANLTGLSLAYLSVLAHKSFMIPEIAATLDLVAKMRSL